MQAHANEPNPRGIDPPSIASSAPPKAAEAVTLSSTWTASFPAKLPQSPSLRALEGDYCSLYSAKNGDPRRPRGGMPLDIRGATTPAPKFSNKSLIGDLGRGVQERSIPTKDEEHGRGRGGQRRTGFNVGRANEVNRAKQVSALAGAECLSCRIGMFVALVLCSNVGQIETTEALCQTRPVLSLRQVHLPRLSERGFELECR